MEKIDFDQVINNLKKDLNLQLVSGKTLLDRLCVINENSRKTSAYLDHKYAPFYYHLGKYLPAKSFLEIGFNIGLLSSCFFMSCKSVDRFFGFKEKTKEFVPQRIGETNIRKFVKNKYSYIGNTYDEKFYIKLEEKWDLILINEEKEFDKQLEYIEIVWPHINENGVLIVEYTNSHKPSKNALKAFCESKSLKPINLDTRYGTSLIIKC